MATLSKEEFEKQYGPAKRTLTAEQFNAQYNQPAKQPGLISRIKDVFTQRGKNVDSIVDRTYGGEQSKVEGAGQIAGQALGAAGDIAFETIKSVTPKPIKDVASKVIGNVASTKPVKTAIESYNEWANNNPRAAADIEAGFNIITSIPALKGAGKVSEVGIKNIATKSGKLASFYEGRLANQILDDAIRVTKPELNKAEKIALLRSGQAETGWFGQIKSLPTDRDIAVAETVKDLVSSKKSPINNIRAINSEIARVGEEADSGLKGIGAIYNDNQLTSRLNSAKNDSRVIFGSEKSIENTYDAVIDEFMRIKAKYPNTVGGLRDARVEFDGVVKQKFPKVFDNPAGTDVARYNAIVDVRRAVNDYSFDLLPENHPYKKQLETMTNLYAAQKNIAVKTAKTLDVGQMQKVMKMIRQNPLVSGVTGGILTFGAFSGLLTNPLLLGGLMIGGSYKVGKKIITSQTLKKALINILEKGKGLDELNRGVIRNFITEIDSYGSLPTRR